MDGERLDAVLGVGFVSGKNEAEPEEAVFCRTRPETINQPAIQSPDSPTIQAINSGQESSKVTLRGEYCQGSVG